jgi:hypothetical protein
VNARLSLLVVGLAIPFLIAALAGQAASNAQATQESAVAAPPAPPAEGVPEPHESPATVPPVDVRVAPPLYDPTARGPIVLREFVSYQVNVNALGQNIVGDAANEPSIAVDPTNPLLMSIGWRQFDSVDSDFRQAGVAYTVDAGSFWTFPGVLDPGVFRSDPVLAANGEGDFFYYSLDEDFTCQMFRSFDQGETWGGPIEAYGGDKAWMAIDRTGGRGDGHIYLFWDHVGCCGDDWFTRSTDNGLTFESPIPIPGQPIWGTCAVGPDGELYIAGRRNQQSSTCVIAKSTTVSNPDLPLSFDFSTEVYMGGEMRYPGGSGSPNPGGLLGQIWIAVNHAPGPHRGDVYVLSTVDPPGDDPLDIYFMKSTDGGVNWSTPTRVNSDLPTAGSYQWFGTMAVSPGGRIDVVWVDTRASQQAQLGQVYTAASHDGGETFTDNFPMTPQFDSHVGWPQQNKMGDYYDMVAQNAGSNLAYAATFNDEQDIYYLWIPADCNNNDEADLDDILGEVSEDCNENLMPDECEPDCNNNGEADACDILNGISEDCNQNQVPDECDIANGDSADNNDNGVPDECEIEIVYVNAAAAESGAGTSWSDALVDLSEALALADGSLFSVREIWVAQGTYKPAGVGGSRAATFDVPDGVEVYGGFFGQETERAHRNPVRYRTVLSGDLNGDDAAGFVNRDDNSYHVVTSTGTAFGTVLDGFVIVGGSATAGDPQVDIGAGILLNNSSAKISRCIVAENQAGLQGGGICILGGAPQLENLVVVGNRVTMEGGGIYIDNGASATVKYLTMYGNWATPTSGLGGGIYATNTTFLSLSNSILWFNRDMDGYVESSQLTVLGSYLVEFDCVQGWTGEWGGEGMVAEDPQFIDTQGPDGLPGTGDEDLRLQFESPCRETGDPYVIPWRAGKDLDGHARVLCLHVDMGAYEANIGDYSCDGAVDLEDYESWLECFAGPDAGTYPVRCSSFDYDYDGDVDVWDFRELSIDWD